MPLPVGDAMTDREQLAGYDDDGIGRPPEPPALETPPAVPAASSPELRTLVAVAVGAIVNRASSQAMVSIRTNDYADGARAGIVSAWRSVHHHREIHCWRYGC
jgi:hypothetical protein